MVTDDQVVKMIDDILKILQPIKYMCDRKKEDETIRELLETMHDECLDLPSKDIDSIWKDRRVRLGDVLEVFNERLNLLCPCGNKIDTNDGQQTISKMCQSCLDNAQ